MNDNTAPTANDLADRFRDAYLALGRGWRDDDKSRTFRAADVALHEAAGCLPQGWTDPRGYGLVHTGPCPILFARDKYAVSLARLAKGRENRPDVVEDNAYTREALIAALG